MKEKKLIPPKFEKNILRIMEAQLLNSKFKELPIKNYFDRDVSSHSHYYDLKKDKKIWELESEIFALKQTKEKARDKIKRLIARLKKKRSKQSRIIIITVDRPQSEDVLYRVRM